MMAHNDKIRDTETHFLIDPLTRSISNASAANNTIVQYDHNSERFTFEIPRYVDGHDMFESTEVRIHYRNATSSNLGKTNGVYIPDDMALSEESEDTVTFSWLLSSATTQYIGFLYFSIQFVCLNGDTVEYAWNTGVYKDINIIESINNTDEVVAAESDVIAAIKNDLTSVVETALQDAKDSGAFDGERGDTGPQGIQGEQGIQGIQGIQGEQGEQGIQGEKGDKGDKGDQGIQGEQGIQGIQGIQGEKGDKGDKGDSGVVAPIDGFFTLSVDADGNLWAYSEDGEAPNFEYDAETGNLYVVQEQG